eukprot:scaffold228_cov312-Pinguiococcus_pyrenoidosus.AAC.3
MHELAKSLTQLVTEDYTRRSSFSSLQDLFSNASSWSVKPGVTSPISLLFGLNIDAKSKRASDGPEAMASTATTPPPPDVRDLRWAAEQLVKKEEEAVQRSSREHLATLTAEARAALAELRCTFQDAWRAGRLREILICNDLDGSLLEQLERHKWDVARARRFLQKHLKWRADNRVSDVLNKPKVPQWKHVEFRRHWAGGFHNRDRLGHPMYVDRAGSADLTRLRQKLHMSADDMMEMYLANIEIKRRYLLPKLSRQAGRRVGRFSVLLDLTGLDGRFFSTSVFGYLQRISKAFSNNYEELQHTIVVANAPRIFQRFWSLVKGFVPKETLQKVRILDSNKPAAEQIGDLVEVSQLPQFFGGTSLCGIGEKDDGGFKLDSGAAYERDIDRAKQWLREGKQPEIEEAILDGRAAKFLDEEGLSRTDEVHQPGGHRSPMAAPAAASLISPSWTGEFKKTLKRPC